MLAEEQLEAAISQCPTLEIMNIDFCPKVRYDIYLLVHYLISYLHLGYVFHRLNVQIELRLIMFAMNWYLIKL